MDMIAVCPGCKATFTPHDPRQRYCTPECRRTVRGICIDCGTAFTKKRGSQVTYDRCHDCAQVVSHRKRLEVLAQRGDIYQPRALKPMRTVACEQCGADMTLTDDSDRRWCSAECKYDARMDSGKGARPAGRGERHCMDCSADISHVWSRRRCRDCDVRLMKDRARAKGDRGRARYYGVPYEYVSRRKVYERDGWQCGICSELIDRTLVYPDPRSASLDHVIPISLGGPHTADNCQAAHLDCNLTKSNQVGDELDKAGVSLGVRRKSSENPGMPPSLTAP